MSKWDFVPFSSLYLIPSKNGLSRPKRVRGSGYKMINMGELFAYDRINNPDMELVPMNEREKEIYTVQPGDLLFARQSLVAEGAGKCSIVLRTPETTTFESHLIRARLNPEKAVPLFYYYYFTSPIGKSTVQSLVMQVAAAGIRGSELAQLPVPLPSLPTQRKIAAILSAYDDLIENNTRRIKILEEMAQLIYREWFVKFRFPGHEKVRMVESELGPIPEGWEVYSYKELIDLCIGGDWGSEEPNDKENIEVYIVRGTDFETLYFGNNSELPRRFITQNSFMKRKLQPGDIVIENSVNAKSRCAGKSLFITNGYIKRMNGSGVCASFCKVLRLKEPRLAPIAYFHMKHLYNEGKMQYYQNVATNGIGNFQAMRFIENEAIVIPSDEELLHFMIETFSSVTSSIYSDRNLILRRTRDLLLPKLISGELDVEDLDIAVGGD